MTATAEEPDTELDRLVTAMQEGRLTRADRDRLERLLERPEARARYRRLSLLHASLLYLWHHPAEPQRQGDPRDPAAVPVGDDAAARAVRGNAHGGRGAAWPPAAFAALARRCLQLLARPTPFSLSVAAVTVAGALAIAAAIKIRVSSDQASAPVAGRGAAVATLAATHEAVWGRPGWAAGSQREPGAVLAVDDRLVLESGLVELAFFSGARVVVEGPCEIVVAGRRGLRLPRGRLVVRTAHDPGGHGNEPLFSVATSRGRIDDLGTEFGVDVPAEGNEGVHVFEGAVAVVSGADVAAMARDGGGGRPAGTRLEAGASLAIERDGTIRPIAHVAARRFIAALPAVQAARNADGAAAAAMRPAVWHGENVEQFAPVEARFVRFSVAAASDYEPCLDELEIFATDGRNVARRGTATASGVIAGYAIHAIANVNDGRYGNAHSWICDAPRGWVQIELPRATTIDRIVWSRDRSARPTHLDRVPVEYAVSVSLDGIRWREVATGANRPPFGTPRPPPRPSAGRN